MNHKMPIHCLLHLIQAVPCNATFLAKEMYLVSLMYLTPFGKCLPTIHPHILIPFTGPHLHMPINRIVFPVYYSFLVNRT